MRPSRSSGVAVRDSGLRLEEGLRFEANVDPSVLTVFSRMAGGLTLKDALAKTGVPQDRALAVVREMLETGFLEIRG